MSSKLKSESARINGAKSKGPKTAQGKAASSKNALRHGLTANYAVTTLESQDDFELLLDSYQDRYQPSDGVEMELVQTLAITRWRLRRIGLLETNLIDNELALSGEDIDKEFSRISDDGRLACVFAKLAEGKALSLLIRYEGALNRVYDRTLKQLAEIQKASRRNEPTKEVTDAESIAELTPRGTADFSPRKASALPPADEPLNSPSASPHDQ